MSTTDALLKTTDEVKRLKTTNEYLYKALQAAVDPTRTTEEMRVIVLDALAKADNKEV